MSRCALHSADGCPCEANATALVIYTDAGKPNITPACDQHATQAVIDGASDGRDVVVDRRVRR